MKRIYLDYAASTPVDRQVEKAMQPYFGGVFGNPHSLHWFGQESSRAEFEARKKIAKSIGADYKEIIFTGSATEANNLAIRGAVKASKLANPEIITLTIEHESVLETCRDLEKSGVKVIYVPVGKDGLVNVAAIKKALNKNTVLVSVMHANNEVGTIQPIEEISQIVKDFKSLNPKPYSLYPLLHTDAVQSFQYLDCGVGNLGVDLMTLSAHKIYGPKGIGVLYVRYDRVDRGDRNDKRSGRSSPSFIIEPIITGSGQEQGLRSGTDNVPYIVGFSKAVEIADQIRIAEGERISKLRDYFWKSLKKALPKIALNGSEKRRLPNNLNIYFPGRKAQELLIKLDLAGLATSPGAACSTRASRGSYVLEAMGWPVERYTGSLRFTLGRPTTKKDIDYSISIIKRSLKDHLVE